ncbi:8-amino-7-oxononanoate synthase [hydrothermal vent metagenome]|uniref:8-amino-7-oxononanoate synthase n=1 Tax=hydrothermal vent metagenome TaxID=652676 RepID=A0A3B1DTA8_9ZZZZ
MNFYKKQLDAIKKSNIFRERNIYNKDAIDIASNDYLGLSTNKKTLKKAYRRIKNYKSHSPKSSLLINGYHKIHKKFENKLSGLNNFENCIVVGSGFLANIALFESMVRKGDILFMDEQYHASGILSTKLIQGDIVFFKHNDCSDLENKILISSSNRSIIAIEGVYSMSGDIASKEFVNIANKYNSILIVDEAHSSGVIGKDLLGWYDYWNIKPELNHIKMGTLGKAYASYGAYILGSFHIIDYLQNRAKSIIYTTAPSLFDIALGYENLKYIINNKEKIKNKIKKYQKLVDKIFNIKTKSLIAPIKINDSKRALDIQKRMLKEGIVIGAIRPPSVKKSIIRIILKLDISIKTTKSIYFTLYKLIKANKQIIAEKPKR